jgi:hypothetical protein
VNQGFRVKFETRRGDRVVDGAALEKRWAISLVGSNPTLSAKFFSMERCWSGRSGAPGERVSPLATVGSNPTLSAIFNNRFCN